MLTAFADGRVITMRTAGGDFDNIQRSVAEPLVLGIMAAALVVADINFVLDKPQKLNAADPTGKFKGKLDMQQVGLVGHSLGGATAACNSVMMTQDAKPESTSTACRLEMSFRKAYANPFSSS